MKFWENEERTGRYPQLARLAKRVFCVQASEAASERVFSIAGLLSDNERANTSPETLGHRVVVTMNAFARLDLENAAVLARKKAAGGDEPMLTLFDSMGK